MQIKISLFFLHSLRVPKVIPQFGVFAAEAAPLPWQADCAAGMDLFAWAQSGCAGCAESGLDVPGCSMV